MYQVTSLSPQKRPAAPPAARKGPNGMGSLRPVVLEPSSTSATMPPSSTAKKIDKSATFQPRNAPSMAPSLTSPPPIPSRPVRSEERRVGKECRSRCSEEHEKKKDENEC